MKKVFQKKHISLVGIAIVGISLGFIVQFVRAWTEPAAAPPGGNIGAPLNTGTQAQTKKGPISIQGYGWNATVPGNSSSPRCACDIGGGQECGAVGSVFTANPTGGNLGDICYDWFSVRVGSSTIPFSAKYVVGSNIRLDNNGVTFANGAYVSGSGIRFADGTIQATAPAALKQGGCYYASRCAVGYYVAGINTVSVAGGAAGYLQSASVLCCK